MSVSALPIYWVLKSNSNDKYVCHTNVDGSMKANGEDVANLHCKFAHEKAGNHEGLVHIRSCYNNNYWVLEAPNSELIVAGAKKPSEKRSESSCTLFEIVHAAGDATTIQIRCVRTGKFVALNSDCTSLSLSAAAGGDDVTKFAVIDWESLVILPKRVAFKGDNEKYLGARTSHFLDAYWTDLCFSYGDIGSPEVAHEITTNPDRSLRIKSSTKNKFWACSGFEKTDWVWPDSPSRHRTATLFELVKVDSEFVALRNLGNHMFCKRLTSQGKTDGLKACAPTITQEAKLRVEEIVISRKINNVKFRDPWIYEEVEILAEQDGTNATKIDDDTMEFTIHRRRETRSSWNRNVSVKMGVSTTIEAHIPKLDAGRVTYSSHQETLTSSSWGEEKKQSISLGGTYKVKIKPGTQDIVTLTATKGQCEIPFSYTARDVLPDGSFHTYEMDDGLYTGIDYYHVSFKHSEKVLSDGK